MPKVIGKASTVVDHGGISIVETVGNVATKQDNLSVAIVTVSEPTAEPWLTLDYEEWICVTRGIMELHSSDGSVLEVQKGETAYIAKGERFRPVFPVADTCYIPICSPAFTPERCVREEEGTSDVSAKLQELHSSSKQDPNEPSDVEKAHADVDKLYHMCQKSVWEDCVAKSVAYFPPTFRKDGMFTHATAVPQRLITTANHFYTAVEGEWICLEMSRSQLLKLGVETIFEGAKPVGETSTDGTWDWVCPHIFGGIPTHVEGVVTGTFKMTRKDDGTFVSIAGLTE